MAIHFPQMRKGANTHVHAYQHLLLSTAVLLLSALSAKWKVAIFYCVSLLIREYYTMGITGGLQKFNNVGRDGRKI